MNWRNPCRRLVEIFAAFWALLLLAPVLLGTALWILACDGRPVLFRQRRAGQGGKLFQILKFRTMVEHDTAPVITAAGDARITSLGKRLRRFKLDELPQLFNVLKGEMSLIGPRPEVPRFIDANNLFWQKVLQVKPGITDLATLLFRDEEELLASAPDPEEVYLQKILPVKLKLNVRYLTRRTWKSDLQLLWLTGRYSLFPQKFDRPRIARWFGIAEPELMIRESPATPDRQELSIQGNR
ncbi:MAG TPA: sugar transferase [Bryobacteraceae bacterium]|nr:sugar transferase [Bryobacteraceae bacterium]